VINIWQRFAAEGAPGLVSKPRGRKPDEQRACKIVEGDQAAAAIGLRSSLTGRKPG
jgi:hypothetical protein